MCILHECKSVAMNYGNYCYKHRSKYLLYDNGLINFNHFTGKASDYLVKDIRKTLMSLGITAIPNSKKNQLYELLFKYYIEVYCSYEKYTPHIIKIQTHIRNYLSSMNTKLRGEGFINKKLCKNDIDFFTYETIQEINDLYFFSYKDTNDFIWFFDIRSFNKLIEKGLDNPYTREKIPQSVISNASKLSLKLKLPDIPIINDLQLTREQLIKQKTIDIFSIIEQLGYECHFDWFLNLNQYNLKKLYRNLEDIWNYRVGLRTADKIRIAPPDGRIFMRPVPEINTFSSKYDLQNLILNDIHKFDNAQDADKKLGFMYFLIGLGMVSPHCFSAHEWMMLV